MKVGQTVYAVFRFRMDWSAGRWVWDYFAHFLTLDMAEQEYEILSDDGHRARVDALTVRSL